MEVNIDDELTTDSDAYVPLLYFICMKAGVQYDKVASCTLPFKPSDPIEYQFADKGIDWTIADSNYKIDLSPFCD